MPPPRPRPARDTGPLTDIDLGHDLRRLRNWAGLSQQSLAVKAGLSDSTISARELGHGLPSTRVLDEFVTACLRHGGGLTAEQIVTELGHWQRARDDLDRQRRTPAAPVPLPQPPALAPEGAPPDRELSPAADEQTAPALTSDTEPPAAELAAETVGAVPEAPSEQAAPSDEDAAPLRWRRGRWLWIAVAVLVAGSVTALITPGLMSQRDGAQSRTPAPSVTSPSRPFVPGQTYTQTANTPAGARTYANPHGLIGEGPRVGNGRNVQVSCKIAIPGAAPSVGRYWYLIADPPWSNGYYSPANAYLNGDPPAGPYTQEVDHAVPDCPT